MVFEKCLWMYVCACVSIRLDLSFYSVDFNRTGLIFFVFFCVMAGQKSVFWLGPCVFVLLRICYVLKIYICFFSMIGLRYFNWMGIIRKKIASYHGFFVINKNMFFLKAYNSQTKRSIFWREIMIMQNINSYNE